MSTPATSAKPTRETVRSPLERAKTQLEAGQLNEAVATLQEARDSSGAAQALLGAAWFRLEKYSAAASALARALDSLPHDRDLEQLLGRARANVVSDVKRPVPAAYQFDKARLLLAPQPGTHPVGASIPERASSLARRLFLHVGNVAGDHLGTAIALVTRTLGRERAAGVPWTDWYTHGFLKATAMLGRRRERLNRAQLFSAYAKGDRVGKYDGTAAMPPWAATARSADGSWNDLSEPMAGAAGTRFGFNTDPARTEAETVPRLLTPNPRTVSRALLTRHGGLKPIEFLNLTAGSWIQFMVHDWVSYGDHADAPPYRIPLDPDDPARRWLHQTEMLVRPTQVDPTRRANERAPSHINEVTSWWDGSQIYGSDAATINRVRSHVGGKLEIDPKTGTLPVLEDGVELAGFRRNWWLGISMLHVLFVKEHNAICDMLAARYTHFDDQKLFDTARLINAAVMAKIHTVEWTPAILPNEVLNAAMNANWYGLLTNALRSKRERRTLAEINIADPIAGGIVGNKANNHGVPYSLTREFLSVYRLHSLLPDEVYRYSMDGGREPLEVWPLAELRQAGSRKITDRVPMHELFYSFGQQHPGQLVLNNYPRTLQALTIPGAGFFDLGAVDILRDRERGVPRYNQFRRLLGMRPIQRFADLTDDGELLAALEAVYQNVEDLDLLIGNLAEARRPTAFGFGETLFEIFILNASRRLQADRFFTDSYREDVYTAEGLAWLDEASYRSVLLRHYPQLLGSGLANLDNGFEPWDTGELTPARHPLRAFDKELRKTDEYVRKLAALTKA